MTMDSGAIGWIGLGKLGLPMAARLVAGGRGVMGYDTDPARLDLASRSGIGVTASAAEAVRGKAVVFTSLPDDGVLRTVLLGAGGAEGGAAGGATGGGAGGGLLALMEPGSILVETSTVGAEASAEVARAAEGRGIACLRLPISGSSALAETGAVTCFASGPRAAFEAVLPDLGCFTRAQTYLGPGEEARYAKLAVNLMIAASAGMMAEALALARRGNVGWQDMLAVLCESAVASPFVKYKVGPLAARDFTPTFSCRQMAKDLDLILDAAGQANVPVPLAALLRQTYAALIAEGDGEADLIAVVRHAERLSGLGEPG
ncbi:NAD(P)-dependent oxidoreductase [Arenibaculum pallidiluteum]|uniref:NAD(P)-dependent oxidoreductase n=1 Tax=Arenibaculum pallidiluteum TaxID=2812559 RepID=UPI001A959537|nr:NAD(P)-dependent oxidoreductase [Arenibaculum pallidiluteum]